MTREEHLAWAKQRALEQLDFNAPILTVGAEIAVRPLALAYASFTSDLVKHTETQDLPFSALDRVLDSIAKGDAAAVREWIENYRPPTWESER